jgi:hypothetical protein
MAEDATLLPAASGLTSREVDGRQEESPAAHRISMGIRPSGLPTRLGGRGPFFSIALPASREGIEDDDVESNDHERP